jgi:hypothetical protein
MMSFDRARVDSLRLALGATVEELRAIRNGDAAAADVMRSLAGACRSIEDWLPRVNDVLYSTAMTSCTRSALGVADISQAAIVTAMTHPGMEVKIDPLATLGPPAPVRYGTLAEVVVAISSGVLQPMSAPLDAHGRAGAPYESLAFAPTSPPQEIGRVDLTSNAAKFADFISDGLPVGWDHTETLIIYRVENIRTTKTVHPLTAFDRDDGPEVLEGHTTEAISSGFIVIFQVTERAELTQDIAEDGDPTANFAFASQESSGLSGAYYPDTEPVFEPIPEGPRYESPNQWTFTQSASPMTDEWGTWHT